MYSLLILIIFGYFLGATNAECMKDAKFEAKILAYESFNAQLHNKLFVLQSQLAEYRHKDELIKQLKDKIEMEKTKCVIDIEESNSADFEEPGIKASSCTAFGNYTGIRKVYYPGINPLSVYCDGKTAGEGWTVIQRRLDGSENFYRSWKDYKKGFGNLHGEFFIGLENLYRIISFSPHELYIELEHFNGRITHAHYNNFKIGNEAQNYKLKSVGKMTGNTKDMMTIQVNQMFSTFDRDNDDWYYGNLAITRHGAWWYKDTIYDSANLNGQYYYKEVKATKGLHWEDRTTKRTVKMLIRRKNN